MHAQAPWRRSPPHTRCRACCADAAAGPPGSCESWDGRTWASRSVSCSRGLIAPLPSAGRPRAALRAADLRAGSSAPLRRHAPSRSGRRSTSPDWYLAALPLSSPTPVSVGLFGGVIVVAGCPTWWFADRRLGRLGPERALTVISELLAACGYAPVRAPTSLQLVLRNCPFEQLARRAPELVCGLNREFLAGLLAGLRTRRIHAVLQPDAVAHPRRCCVLLQGPTH